MKTKIHFILLVLTTMLCNPSIPFAQQSNINANNKNILHHETPEDAYLPNAFNNKKVSPAYKSTSITKNKNPQVNNHTKSTGSNIYTIQVNVNSNNQNIMGDAANEPSIAVNPNNPNQIVIGWRQFDNITSNFRQAGQSYSTDAGQSWTFPGVIEPGIFRSDPVLDFDDSGNLYYNSLTVDNTSGFPCVIFKSTDGGISWGNGVPIGGGDKQWMAIDLTTGPGRGNIYSAWTEAYSFCLPGFFTRSSTLGSSFENCTYVDGSPTLGTEAVGPSGELYITGRDPNTDQIIVAKSDNAKNPGSTITWNAPVIVNMDGFINNSSVNPAGLMGQVNIDVDRSTGPGQGNVYVLASLARSSIFDAGDVMFAKSTDGGLNWGAPIRINDDSTTYTQWFGTMSVAPNGRIDAVWLDTREDVNFLDSSALYYSYSLDQGDTWSVNEKLSDSFYPHIGYPNQNKLGDYFDMISDNTGAHLAWANTFNGEQDVYYSYIVPPVTTGISETMAGSGISIFPNPTRGTIYISGIINESSVEIYNLLGEKLFSKTINSMIDEINISTQPSGIYFVKVLFQDGKSVTKKIIRE